MEPLVGSDPLHAPLAVQEVALVLDQVSIELCPIATDDSLNCSATIGAAVEPIMLSELLPPHAVSIEASGRSTASRMRG